MNVHEEQLKAILSHSCALSSNGADYVELSEQVLDHLTMEWSQMADSPVPPPHVAVEELGDQLRAEGDLAPEQVDALLRAWCPSLETPRREWFRDGSERLLLWLRPWFPLWLAYTEWVLKWCSFRDFDQVLFLARDGLPLYAMAQQLQPRLGTRLTLRTADVPRSLLDSPALEDYLATAVDLTKRTAFVDSGCYGTAVSRLTRYTRDLTGHDDGTAVMFFASRNPRIFGYLNYLMGWHYLNDCSDSPGGRGPADFVVYACDVLESLPKPYRIVPAGQGFRRELTDFTSFISAMRVYIELALYARADSVGGLARATRAATELYGRFRRPRDEPSGNGLFLQSPTPKNPPAPDVRRRLGLTGFTPQSELFGALAG